MITGRIPEITNIKPTFRTSKCSTKRLRICSVLAIAKIDFSDRQDRDFDLKRSPNSPENILLSILQTDVRKMG